MILKVLLCMVGLLLIMLVAFETMRHISKKLGGKVGDMALKLDMSKAYDRVEWVCLEKIMEKLGFADRWRCLVMKCVTSVNYAIKVNGCPMGSITPTRGNGAEGLSSLIKASVANGVLKGISVCRGSQTFPLIFCKR